MDMDYGMRVVYKVQRLECSYYRYLLQWLSCQSYVIDLASQWELAFSSLSLSLSLSPSANQLLLPFSAMGCAGSSQSKPDGEPPLLFNPLKTSSLHSLFVKSLPISSWVAVKIPSFFFLFHGIREQACNFDSKKLY